MLPTPATAVRGEGRCAEPGRACEAFGAVTFRGCKERAPFSRTFLCLVCYASFHARERASRSPHDAVALPHHEPPRQATARRTTWTAHSAWAPTPGP